MAVKKQAVKRKRSMSAAATEVTEAKPVTQTESSPATSATSASERCPKAPEAAAALLKFLEGKQKGTELIPEQEGVWVSIQFTQSLPRSKSRKRTLVEIPHPMYTDEESEVCLITPSPQRKYKDLVAEHGLANVKKVVDMNKLRKKFKSFEQKRQLATSFNLFLADESIMNFLPKILGKPFFSRSKEPVLVDLKKFPTSVEKALRSTSFSLQDNACVSVLLGRYGFDATQIAENCWKVLDEVVKMCPNGWRDVHSCQLKGKDTPGLPIYAHDFIESKSNPAEPPAYPTRHRLSLPEGMVESPKKKKPKKEAAEPASDSEESDDSGVSGMSGLSGLGEEDMEDDEE